jgi:hypothetical protein
MSAGPDGRRARRELRDGEHALKVTLRALANATLRFGTANKW